MSKAAMQGSRSGQQGLTLIEVLIAVVILALIGSISYQALSTSVTSKEVIADNLEKLSRLDRIWVLIETDLKNALSYTRRQGSGPGSGDQLPAMTVVNQEGEYWLTVLRGGHANPLNFPRTEVIRVGYRVEDNVLWRDVWYDLSSTDEDQAQQRKLIEDVESIEVRLLPPNATSYSGGPWVERWPQQEPNVLPLAIEVKMTLEGRAEIARLYTVTKGL